MREIVISCNTKPENREVGDDVVDDEKLVFLARSVAAIREIRDLIMDSS